MAQIDHVFVLMLENRSFDHFFGLSGMQGVPRPGAPGFGPGATDQSAIDPGHEFADVQTQMNGGAMNGFAAQAMLGFAPTQIPVVTQLASQFLLFDNWYSSVPGPTWPNRFFVHAASSGGLADSPRSIDSLTSTTLPSAAFQFQNGSLYDRLAAAGRKWRVYHGDVHPQVLAVEGMVAKSFDSDLFRPIYPSPNASDFAADLGSGGYDVNYTFIEANYAIQLLSQFTYGDSQHPKGLVSDGEALIKFVYETIRNSPVWPNSLLLIVWDEHGGFYDHVAPPAATPPEDEDTNGSRAGTGATSFAFDRFGLRVPAILASPWLQPGAKLGSQVFAGQTFDHTSVISSVMQMFGLSPALTKRDAAAPTWAAAFATVAAADVDKGPTQLASASPGAGVRSALVSREPMPNLAPQAPDAFVEGLALIALDLDRHVSKSTGSSMIAVPAFEQQIRVTAARTAAIQAGADFSLQLLSYIKQVDAKVLKHRAATRKL